MLLCRFVFEPRPNTDLDELEDRITIFLGSLQKNGQLWGDQVVGRVAGAIQAWVQVPRTDSLEAGHWNEWVTRDHARVAELCIERPSWNVVDDRGGDDAAESWDAGPGLVLYTTALGKTSPLWAASDGRAVPIYLLPLSDRMREELYFWAGKYRRLDHVWLDSGPLEMAAYRELAEVDSTFNTKSRDLCRRIEEATEQLTYLYLMRYWGWGESESGRMCPSCGEAWASPPDETGVWLLDDFSFVCEVCRLVSHAGPSSDSVTKASIGDWSRK